ncbi:MAG: hypothetical protein ABI787_06005 [Spartobacteria bacterium]
MRIFLLLVAALEIAIVSPIPALDRWQADYRERMRANIRDYLPENPASAEERALLREICALPDSAFTRE